VLNGRHGPPLTGPHSCLQTVCNQSAPKHPAIGRP
jgi:hypothetical protein